MAKTKKNTVPDALHSKIGPSSSERWMHCPASVALTDKLVKLGKAKFAGSAAREGTAAHTVLAHALMQGKDAWEFTGTEYVVDGETFVCNAEMVGGVQMAIDFVREQMDKYKDYEWLDEKGKPARGAILLVENALSSVLDEEAFGTGDVLIIVPYRLLIVLDFKYGQGVVVEPHDSQLKMYSYMAWEMFGDKYFTNTTTAYPVEQYIMQPRIPHPRGENRGWNTNTKDLTHWFTGEVLPAMRETRNPEAIFQTGAHCGFCPARNHCPALQADTMNLEINRDPVTLTGEELGKLLERIKAIKKYGEKLEEEALNRARQGDKIAGYKLVRKMANRVWREEIKISEPNPEDPEGPLLERVVRVEDILKEAFGDDAYTKPELLGPPGIEKLPGGEAFVSRCAYSPDAGTTLAPMSDKRPEQKPLITLLPTDLGTTAA